MLFWTSKRLASSADHGSLYQSGNSTSRDGSSSTSTTVFWIAPTETLQWALFVMLGLLGGIGLQLMTNAFRRAPASVIAPFEYTALIWATAIGWIGWREWPGDHVWLGAAVLVATGLYITYRESRRGRAGAGAH